MFSFFTNRKRMQSLENRLNAVEEENLKLKKLLMEASIDIASIDTVLKAAVFAQTQLADDVGAIYQAVKQVLQPEDSYSKYLVSYGSDDDDDGGGYLN